MMIQKILATLSVLLCITLTNAGISARASERTILRAALYPYIPEKAECYWKLETDFEDQHPNIDLRFVDLGEDYYSGGLEKALKEKKVDVAEIDTVLLPNLVESNLIEETILSSEKQHELLPQSVEASKINGKLFGVPHWVCGNFLFFRSDDPSVVKLRACTSLKSLKTILGTPSDESEMLLTDLQGSSTVGEKYLDALFDIYTTKEVVEQKLASPTPDVQAVEALQTLFRLSPNGICRSQWHHDLGQYYAKQFAHRRCRLLLGYSEMLHDVSDEFLHGVREGTPAVGKLGAEDIEAVPSALGTGRSALLWIDTLAIRHELDSAKGAAAKQFIDYVTASETTKKILKPEWGHAPRYLLPARLSLYNDDEIISNARLYPSLLTYIRNGIIYNALDLNSKLRQVGKEVNKIEF